MEHLGKLHWVLTAVDVEIARDEAENAVVDGGLGIKALDLVLDLTEGAELLDDGADTLELITLETEHRVVSVQLLQLL